MDHEDKQSFKFDVTDLKAVDPILTAFFNKISSEIKALSVISRQFNKEGAFTSATFKAMTNDGREVQATMRSMAGAMDVYIHKNKQLREVMTGLVSTPQKSFRVTGVSETGSPIQEMIKAEAKMRDIATRMNEIWGIQKVKSQDIGNWMNANFDRNKLFEYYQDWNQAILQNAQFDRKQALDTFKQRMFGMSEQAATNKKILAAMLSDEKTYRLSQQLATDKGLKDFVAAESQKQRIRQQMVRIQRQEFLRDWSEANVENKERNAPSSLDKLFNRAFVIGTGIAISQVFLKVASDITGAITAAGKFQIKMSEIRTLSTENQLTMAQWSEEVRKLSDRFGSDAFDTAQGVYQTLSNQVAKGAESTKFMIEAQKFAAVAVTTTEESVNALSSAINAYGLTTNDTATIAASFFKLIDLGRIQGKEFANTIGTVYAITSQLKIPMDDVNAALGVMTRQGVTASNAMTYLRNVTASLLKPSEKMTEVFKDWGVRSGQDALNTFGGLVGVIEKLSEIVDRGGLEELAQDMKNLRSIQGVALLTGSDNLTKFKSDVAAYKQELGSYADKVKIAFESAGKTVELFWNKLKNTFLFDFGTKFVEGFAGTIKILGGVDGAITNLSKTLAIGAIAWGTYKLATGGWETIALKAIYAFDALKASALRLYAVMLANPWALLATAVASVIAYLVLYGDTTEKVLKTALEAAERQAEELKRIDLERIAKQEQMVRESQDKQFQIIYDNLSKVRTGYSQFVTFFEEKLDTVKESLRETADVFKETFSSYINDIKQNVSQLNSLLKGSQNALNAFDKRHASKQFEDSLEGMSPFKRVKAELEEAARIRAQANAAKGSAIDLLASGDTVGADEKLKQARTLFDEAYQLIDRAQKEDKAGIKDSLDPIKNKILKDAMYNSMIKNQNLYNESILREQNIKQDVHNMEEQIQSLSRKKAKEQDEEYERLKRNKIVFFDQLKAAEGLKITKKDTQETLAEKIAQIDEAENAVRRAVLDVPGAGSLTEGIGLIDKLEAKKSALEAIYNGQKDLNELNKEAAELDKRKAKSAEDLKKAFSDQKAAIVGIDEQSTKLRAVLSVLPGNFQHNLPTFSDKDTPQEKINKSNELLKIYEDIINEINKAQKDPDMYVTINANKAAEILRNGNAQRTPLIGFIEQFEQSKLVIDQTQTAILQMQDAVKSIEDIYKMTFENSTTTVIENNKLQLKSFEELIEGVKAKVIQLQGIQVLFNYTGGQTQTVNKAFGGFIPRGFDTVPAMLSPGEFVVNAGASRQFYSQLVAINGGTQYKNGGGMVSNNNFGNINVTVAGGQSNQATARDLAVEIRRQVKRGMVPPF